MPQIEWVVIVENICRGLHPISPGQIFNKTAPSKPGHLIVSFSVSSVTLPFSQQVFDGDGFNGSASSESAIPVHPVAGKVEAFV